MFSKLKLFFNHNSPISSPLTVSLAVPLTPSSSMISAMSSIDAVIVDDSSVNGNSEASVTETVVVEVLEDSTEVEDSVTILEGVLVEVIVNVLVEVLKVVLEEVGEKVDVLGEVLDCVLDLVLTDVSDDELGVVLEVVLVDVLDDVLDNVLDDVLVGIIDEVLDDVIDGTDVDSEENIVI